MIYENLGTIQANTDVIVRARQGDEILMRFVAGMPLASVAKTLHKTEDSIKGLQRRALTNLRAILTDWEVTYARP